MKVTLVVPARLASTRIPRKPLLTVNGCTLVQQAVDACVETGYPVVLTSESEDVLKRTAGQEVSKILSSETITSGSDRLASIEPVLVGDYFALVPCDLWRTSGKLIREFVEKMLSHEVEFGTLVQPLATANDLEREEVVKAFTDVDDYAVWFTRKPYSANGSFPKDLAGQARSQVGLYWYSRAGLRWLNQGRVSPLELSESNESLRILLGGKRLLTHTTREPLQGINTFSDLASLKQQNLQITLDSSNMQEIAVS